MAATTTNDILNGLERDYHPKKLMSMALKAAPLTAWMPKREDGSGEICVIRYLVGNAGGVGSSMANAKTNQKAPLVRKALVDWKIIDSYWSVENPAIKRAEGSGLGDLLQMGMRQTMSRHGNEIETFLFGDGNAQLGKRASISSNTITLTNKNDAFNFEYGMLIKADDTADGSSPRAGSAYVTTVDYSNGKVTVDNAAGITGFADNDFLFDGEFINAAPSGLTQIITPGTPGAYGGLTRTTEPEMLSGWKYTGNVGDTMLEQIIQAYKFGTKFEGDMDTLWLSTDRGTQLELELTNKKIEFQKMSSRDLGLEYTGIKLVINGKEITVMSAVKCPNTVGWFLERSTWDIQSVNEPLIAVATKTGKFIDAEVNDEIVLKFRSQFQVRCPLPSHNGAITWV